MPTKKNRSLQDSELPLETVLNPGLLMIKDSTYKPVDTLFEKAEETDPQTPIA